jgi:hypothetical protein
MPASHSSDESITAAEIYGYEDPDELHQQRKQNQSQQQPFLDWRQQQPRRSSMKQEAGSGNRPRRASMHSGGGGGVGIIEVRLPGQSAPVLRRTSIDFMIPAKVIMTEKPSSDHDDFHASWMAPEDYDKIAHDNQKIVKAIEKGTEKNFCTRGLEDLLDHHHAAGRMRDEASQAVWEEQHRQKNAGIFDEVQIMERYRMAGVQSILAAADRAEQDEADIEDYTRKTRRMMRRMSC